MSACSNCFSHVAHHRVVFVSHTRGGSGAGSQPVGQQPSLAGTAQHAWQGGGAEATPQQEPMPPPEEIPESEPGAPPTPVPPRPLVGLQPIIDEVDGNARSGVDDWALVCMT